ncbi:MAG: serine/threonine-protein kinase [Bacteroidota bacterium]
MDQARWKNIQELFEKSLHLSGKERETYLQHACQGDETLLQEINLLLANIDPSSDFFQHLEGELSQAFHLDEVSYDFIDLEIGTYRIVQEIGMGGMGKVFKAKRTKGDFDQDVAIKFVHPDPWNRGLGRKFRREKQILSNLQHPHIAQIYDGGETKDGLSYLIMEYVDGKHVMDYVTHHKLDLHKKIDLFLKIAESIAYAHTQLVLHGDIKPSNVLIDPNGEPKLLDFGIAKLIDSSEGTSAQTQTQAFTPEYSSPEQIQGISLQTSSDVYQLGLLLYEMLTEKRAFQFEGKNMIERNQHILHHIPKSPSSLAQNSKNRQLINGDLDNIIMACIRKEPSKRYQDVRKLIQDLKAYQQNQPISLKYGNWNYRSRKFIERNRVAVSLLSLSFLLLLVGLFVISKETTKTKRALQVQEQALAKEMAVRDFLETVMDIHDPYGSSSQDSDTLTVNQSILLMLDRSVKAFKDKFKEEPVLTKELLFVSIDYYRKLENYEKSVQVLALLDSLCKANHACDSYDFATIQHFMGTAAYTLGNFKEADSSFRQALDAIHQLTPSPLRNARNSLILMDYGEFRSAVGHVKVADSLFSEANKLFNWKADSILDRNFKSSRANNLLIWSRIKSNLGQYEKAIQLADSGLSINKNNLGKENFSHVRFYYQIGQQFMYLQQWDSSYRYFTTGISLYQKLAKEPDWLITALLNDLANVLGGQKKYTQQDSILEETLKLKWQVFGYNHLYNAPTWLSKGHANMALKQFEVAEKAYVKALTINQSNLPKGHQNTAACYLALGRLKTTQHQYKEAERYARKGLEEIGGILPDDHRVVAFGQMFLGQALFYQGKKIAAEPYLKKSLESMQKLKLASNIREIDSLLAVIK